MGDSRDNLNTDNRYLYMIKGLACILVIFIHCLFPNIIGKDIQAMSRFAVLYFFVVSGRYLLRNLPDSAAPSIVRKRMASKIRHVFIITLILTLLYNIYSFAVAILVGYGAADLAAQKYNFGELKLLLMFNSGKIIYDYTYDIDHLWYLYAVLYVFVLIYIFAGHAKKWSGFLAVFFTGALFFAQLLQLYYPIRPFDISIRTWYVVRNWLLEGIPFIMAGVWLDSAINDKRDTKAAELVRKLVNSCATGQNAKRNCIILHVLLIAGIVMSVLEYRRFGEMTVYVGSLLTICAIMLLGEAYAHTDHFSVKSTYQRHPGKDSFAATYLYHPEKDSFAATYLYHLGKDSFATTYLYHLGKDLSATVYYFHIMIISIISRTLFGFEVYPLYQWLKPVIAVFASVLVAELVFVIKERIQMNKRMQMNKRS